MPDGRHLTIEITGDENHPLLMDTLLMIAKDSFDGEAVLLFNGKETLKVQIWNKDLMNETRK